MPLALRERCLLKIESWPTAKHHKRRKFSILPETVILSIAKSSREFKLKILFSRNNINYLISRRRFVVDFTELYIYTSMLLIQMMTNAFQNIWPFLIFFRHLKLALLLASLALYQLDKTTDNAKLINCPILCYFLLGTPSHKIHSLKSTRWGSAEEFPSVEKEGRGFYF